MPTPRFSGILPAVVTPFHPDSSFAPNVFETLLHRLYSAGVRGVYIAGQTGEGIQQTVPQRKRLLEAALAFSPSDKLIICHVGAVTTADALALAEHAAAAGAHAIASLPPVGLVDFAEIREYYETLASASSLPLFVYHHPEWCPQLTPERALSLAEIPGVVGFKFTDFNLYLLSLLRARNMILFNGKDEVLAAGLFMGATGGIGTFYNLFPAVFVKLLDLASRGQWGEASALQARLNPLLHQIFQFPLVPAIREGLAIVGIETGQCLSPRRQLLASEKQQIRSILDGLSDEMRGYLLTANTTTALPA